MGDHYQRVGLGHHLVVVVEHGLGQVLEHETCRGTEQGDLGGLLAGEADDAELNAPNVQDLIGLRPGRQVPVRALHDNVRPQPGELRLSHSRRELILTLVELVVSEGR